MNNATPWTQHLKGPARQRISPTLPTTAQPKIPCEYESVVREPRPTKNRLRPPKAGSALQVERSEVFQDCFDA